MEPKVNKKKVEENIVELYEAREKIYPRETNGPFQKLRNYGLTILLAIYFLIPWINFHGRQAILFDMPHRRFYLFDLVIWPQDFIILTIFLLVMAFTLFFITALAGRIWCGYACPQTIWTESFIWLERLAEGNRQKQIKLDKMPWCMEKIYKKTLKHFLWIVFALLTGLTFVGYFTPVRQLFPDFFTLNASGAATFWAIFYGVITYLNAGWLREQLCKAMCPYARFQGAMYDENTLLVAYDNVRGEPRRKAKRGENQDGHCIDCSLCVQVCPVGIDIRNGSQYQCIGCALCIDACNDVMHKIDAPKGLIRYASENQINHKRTRFIRPKTIGYAVVLLVGFTALIYNVSHISTIDVNVKRDRNILSRKLSRHRIENLYNVNILNKTLTDATYQLSAEGIDNLKFKGDNKTFTVKSGKVYGKTVGIIANEKDIGGASATIYIKATNIKTGESSSEKTRFLNAIK